MAEKALAVSTVAYDISLPLRGKLIPNENYTGKSHASFQSLRQPKSRATGRSYGRLIRDGEGNIIHILACVFSFNDTYPENLTGAVLRVTTFISQNQFLFFAQK